MTAALTGWKATVVDSLGMVLVIWSIPAAIVLVGAPIALAVALLLALGRWLLQP